MQKKHFDKTKKNNSPIVVKPKKMSNIAFEELYSHEIDTFRTAFEVIEPEDQKELVKWIPDMIKYLISKKIIDDKSKL